MTVHLASTSVDVKSLCGIRYHECNIKLVHGERHKNKVTCKTCIKIMNIVPKLSAYEKNVCGMRN